MSAILQVRGEDGQFIDIPALVGPPGADGTDGVSPTVSSSEMREALRILRHALDCRSPGAPL